MRFSLLTKITYKPILNIFFFLYLFVISNYSYSLSNKFYHLGLQEGLSQNSVLSIVQDHQGFMWFATYDGLNRFDGYEFEVYRHDSYDPNSISDSAIGALLVDRKGRLWVGTRSSGVDLYDPATKTFSHYRFPLRGRKSTISKGINTMLEDREGILWFGSLDTGLIRFDEKNNSYQHYLHNKNNSSSISHNHVNAIFEDSYGRLWIGTVGGGLNLFHRNKEHFEHFRFENNNPLSLSNDHVKIINEDHKGKLWIGTNSGLNRFDPDKKIFNRYYHTNESGSISNNSINHINRDSKQQLWISTDNGINIYHENTDNFTHIQYNIYHSDGLNDKDVRFSYEDANKNIWIGTKNGGINRFNPRNNNFYHIRHEPDNKNSLLGNSVFSIHQDQNDNIWIGTANGGLNKYHPQTNRFIYYAHDPNNPNSISENRVGTIYQDSQGIHWIGTYNTGLNRFDEKTGMFQRFFNDGHDENSLSDNMVIDILEDYQNILWVGTHYGGLNRFDQSIQTFTHFRHDPDDETSISSDQVWVIHQDKQNSLWIGTGTGGLNVYDRENNQFVRFEHSVDNSNSLSNNSVLAIHENKLGNLWIGTKNGLNYLDISINRFFRYYIKDGLPSNTIYSIEEDSEGNLWMATNKGLSKFNPSTRLFENYGVDDGLQSDEFNSNASMMASNGELYFGGINGITRFYPSHIQVDSQAPKVAITRFLLFNKPVPIMSDITNSRHTDHAFSLEKDIGVTSELTLSHKESLFAFDFAVLHYSNPKKNQYAYQLAGWDKNWIFTDYKIRRATYTNIPSGNYTFRVKASNSDGTWNEQGASIRINILPPPWKTWWAYSLYGLFVVLLMVVLFMIVLKRNQLKQEREHTSRLSQLDKLKDEFMANTSHELRTPLNGIIGLTEGLLDYEAENLNENVKDHLITVIHSSKRLAHLINDILDFSKLKNKSIELQMKSIDVHTLTDIVLTLIKPLICNKPIAIVNNIHKKLSAVKADENRLEQILYNLIGNAIKFTHEGEIEIYARKIDEKIKISVRDTGIGIPRNKLESIFQSFEQAAGSIEREYGGSGIGLAVTKQLVELHHGEISVESQMNVGSIFTFDLPVSHEPIVAINTAVAVSPVPKKIIPFNRPIHVESIIAAAANDIEDRNNFGFIKSKGKHSCEDNFKILIVDDEEMNRLVVCNYLRDNKYELYEAVNGEEVLAAIEVMHFDLILLDVMMPKMSGFEVCKRIREKYTPNEQAIIFLTAKTQRDDISNGFNLGVNDYLVKPIVKKELLTRIKAHLQLVSYYRSIA